MFKEAFDKALEAQSRTILIVDDEPANLAVVADYLAQSGFQIIVAQTGESGLELARRTLPDLILLDVQLPVTHTSMAAELGQKGNLVTARHSIFRYPKTKSRRKTKEVSAAGVEGRTRMEVVKGQSEE
ncbi:MAG: response regulator [Chloroflexota bacterium]